LLGFSKIGTSFIKRKRVGEIKTPFKTERRMIMENPRLIEKALEKEGYTPGKEGYIGIDYGNGMSNIDHKTNIRYGVIPQREVLQAWCDSSEPNYGTPEEAVCPKCDKEYSLGKRKKGWNWGDSYYCRKCREHFDIDVPDCAEPLSFYIDDGEYFAEGGGDDPDIFITKSPYFTKCQLCSPCAPGAGYLMTPMPNGVEAYCFGHDFFEDGKAPYPVYRVESGELIEP
jgi:hypothetical protein